MLMIAIILMTVAGLLVLSIPFFVRNGKLQVDTDLGNPFLFLVPWAFIGMFMRGVTFSNPLNGEVANRMLIGFPPTIMLGGAAIFLLSAIMLVAGHYASGYLPPLRMPTFPGATLRRTPPYVFLLLAIGITLMVALCLYIFIDLLHINLDDLEDFSRKRGSAQGGVHTAFGYVRLLGNAAGPAVVICVLAFIAHGSRIFSMTALALALVIPSLLAFGFFVSSRSGFGLWIIFAGIAWYYARNANPNRRPITFRQLMLPVIALLIVLQIILVMTTFRKKETDPEQIFAAVTLQPVLKTFIESYNFIGICKTSVALQKIPDSVDPLPGVFLVGWLVAPVPRTMWPDKPQVSLGYRFLEEVWGKEADERLGGGLGPGVIVEFYWIGGLPLVILGNFLLGVMISYFYRSIRPGLLRGDLFSVSLLIFLLQFALPTYSANLSQGVIQGGKNWLLFIVELGAMMALTSLLTKRPPRLAAPAPRGGAAPS